MSGELLCHQVDDVHSEGASSPNQMAATGARPSTLVGTERPVPGTAQSCLSDPLGSTAVR
jgi:hypothetical protein